MVFQRLSNKNHVHIPSSVPGELSLALVISSKAHAKLISVDASRALQMPGVVDFIDHKDIPANNYFGAVIQDQTVFAVDEV